MTGYWSLESRRQAASWLHGPGARSVVEVEAGTVVGAEAVVGGGGCGGVVEAVVGDEAM